MLITKSVFGVPIRLTEERWTHIVKRHTYLKGQQELVLETVSSPDAVYEGDRDELLAVRYYPVTPKGAKFLVVVYKETSQQDGFVITAYLTGKEKRLLRRRQIWRKP